MFQETLKYCDLLKSRKNDNVVDIRKLNGATKHWTYYDEYKNPIARACRQGDERWQEKPGVNGAWVKGAPKGAISGSLYNLPNILKYLKVAKKAKQTPCIIIVEGEKCADAAAELWPGHVVTTSRAGAGNWDKADWSVLKNCNIWGIADADKPGHNYIQNVLKHLVEEQDCNAKIALPNLKKHKEGEDIADWIENLSNKKARNKVQGMLRAFNPDDVEIDDNAIEFNARGLKVALDRMQIKFRYNELGACLEIRKKGKWTIPDEGDLEGIIEALGNRFTKPNRQKYNVSLNKLIQWLMAVEPVIDGEIIEPCAPRSDTIKEFLESLPEWDNIPRLDDQLYRLFGAKRDKLSAWASRYPYLGIIQRTFQPGSKLDETPILLGPSGIGKSAWAENILPEWALEDLFGNTVDFSKMHHKEICEAVIGCVLVELAELAGMRKADVNNLKAFMTRRFDKFRPAYARDVKKVARRFVPIGTSNDSGSALPNDAGGGLARRFVIIELETGTNIEKFMKKYRLQLWAEALHRYKKGARANLPKKLKAQAAKAAEKHRSKDPMEEMVNTYLKACEKANILYRTKTEILSGINEKYGNQGQWALKRISDAIDKTKWQFGKRRVPGEKHQIRAYFSPKFKGK